MNDTLILAMIRQRLRSPIRMGLLAMWVFGPLFMMLFESTPNPQLPDPTSTFTLVLILGAGMIGTDVSSGVLQLLFARPVKRSDYVLSRWLAAATLAAGLALVQVIIACIVISAHHRTLPTPANILFLAGQHVSAAFGCAAVLTALSALAPGFGDLALYFLLFMCTGLTQMLGSSTHSKLVTGIGDEMLSSLVPQVDLSPLFGGAPDWYDMIAYASTMTLSLLVAIHAVNRRELSYASG